MRWIFRQLELRLFSPAPKKAADAKPARAGAGKQGAEEPLRAWCAGEAERLGMPELSRRVQVRWNPRMRTTAGRAWWPDRVIELNPKLNELPSGELWRTLKHELAHLVAYERAGRRRIEPHGPEWRAACADLGIPGERPFHTLPLKGRRMKRNYSYSCPSCQSTFQRVRRIRRMVACYDCCRKFTGGQFDSQFRLKEQKL
jgi:predicted SprT family Zn-dependent metalloprotease